MSKPTTPDQSKRRGSTPTKGPGSKRAEWDFTTLSTTDSGWTPLERSKSSASAGKASASSPYVKDSTQEDEQGQKEGAAKEAAAAAKAKPSKASADLSPYMSVSPYMSRAGGASHSRPVSRGMPSSSSSLASNVYSNHRRSLPHAPGGAGSGSRPITPVTPAGRPKSQGSSDQPGARGHRYSGGQPKPRDAAPQRPASQGTIGFGLGGSTGAAIRSVSQRPTTSGQVGTKGLGAHSGEGRAEAKSPGAAGGRSLSQAAGYVAELSIGPVSASQGASPAAASSRPTAVAPPSAAASAATEKREQPSQHTKPATPPSPARPASQQAQARPETAEKAPASPSPSKAHYPQRPPPSPASPVRPSLSRASTRARRSSSPDARSPQAETGRRGTSGSGHRAAALAISGLRDSNDANRPTTQERHAAQREQLGFGRRPTTQERQSLTTRAGPRTSARSLDGERPGSRGGQSDELNTRLRNSFSERSSRLKHSEGTGDCADAFRRSLSLTSGSRSQSRSGGARGRHEDWSQEPVPVIAENTEGEAYGMTLSDYMSQMGSKSSQMRPQSGASATMAAEDCIPPDDASLLSDISDCSDYSYVDKVMADHTHEDYDDESYTQYGQHMDRSLIPWEPMEGGSSFSTAAGNGLDLRPATAALDNSTKKPLLGHDAITESDACTREVDLASLPAALFHPREESTSRRPSGSGRSDSVWHRHDSGRASGRHSANRAAARQRPRGARKTQSARPMMLEQGPGYQLGDAEDGDEADLDDDDGDGSDDEWGEMHYMRPPSRQRPPPEALHLFNALGQNNKGALTPTMAIKAAGDGRSPIHRPKTTAAPTRPLSGPQLRLKSDGTGLENATEKEKENLSKMCRPPSRMRNPVQSASIRHNAAEDFPELPPKGQGEYDLDIMGFSSDSEYEC